MPNSATLSEMVDLALGTPEIGCVNHTILHRFLHAILYQLHIGSVRAELPDDSEKEFLGMAPKLEPREGRNNGDAETGAGENSEEPVGDKEEKERYGAYAQSEADSGVTGVAVVTEPVETSEEKETGEDIRVIPFNSRTPYHQLEEKVVRLENKLRDFESLPSNKELWERAGTDDDLPMEFKPRPVAEMWQSMQLTRKVDANTQGVSKLMSLVEDLMLEMQALNQLKDKMKQNDELLQHLNDLASQMELKVKELDDRVPTDEVLDGFVTWSALEDSLKGLKQPFDPSAAAEDYLTEAADLEPSSPARDDGVVQPSDQDLTQGTDDRGDAEGARRDSEVGQAARKQSEAGMVSRKQSEAGMISRKQSEVGRKQSEVGQFSGQEGEWDLPRDLASRPMSRRRSRLSTPGPSLELQDLLERLGKLTECYDDLEARVDLLEIEMAKKGDLEMLRSLGFSEGLNDQLRQMLEDIESMKDKQGQDSDYLDHLRKLTDTFQGEFERLNSSVIVLSEDSLKHKDQLEDLGNTCTDLEEKKADKEFVQNEVNLKADKENLDGKVNRSQFESACDEINQMINDILGKLLGNQGEWKAAMDLLNNGLDGKVDRQEFGPFRDELEKQLRALAKKIAGLQNVRDDSDEAAGIRKQLIQRFHCISCDRPIGMTPKEPNPSLPNIPGIPETKGNRPYVAYELDQIRQLKRNYQWTPQYSDIVDLYATSRACGGSHTLTYPHRRIIRSSNGPAMYLDEPPHHPPPPYRIDTDGGGTNRIARANSAAYGGVSVPTSRLPNVHTANRSSAKQMRAFIEPVRPQSPPQPGRPTSAHLSLRPVSSRNEVLTRSKTMMPSIDEPGNQKSFEPPLNEDPAEITIVPATPYLAEEADSNRYSASPVQEPVNGVNGEMIADEAEN